MLIALPNVDGSFTVTLFLPNQGEESFQALTTPEAVHALFERRFADAIPLMPRLVEDFFGNPTGHLETIRCAPWSFEDHALVLGDAAHAIVPFHGQGMNAAFEDCSAFDRCLEDPDRPWNEVFAEFEKRRRPNTDAIADMALENYVEMRSTVREPKFQLKKDLSFRLEERHPGRFIPRYSMVMFHTIPYAEAKRRGAIQEEILDELTSAGGEPRRGRPRARRPADRRAAGDRAGSLAGGGRPSALRMNLVPGHTGRAGGAHEAHCFLLFSEAIRAFRGKKFQTTETVQMARFLLLYSDDPFGPAGWPEANRGGRFGHRWRPSTRPGIKPRQWRFRSRPASSRSSDSTPAAPKAEPVHGCRTQDVEHPAELAADRRRGVCGPRGHRAYRTLGPRRSPPRRNSSGHESGSCRWFPRRAVVRRIAGECPGRVPRGSLRRATRGPRGAPKEECPDADSGRSSITSARTSRGTWE